MSCHCAHDWWPIKRVTPARYPDMGKAVWKMYCRFCKSVETKWWHDDSRTRVWKGRMYYARNNGYWRVLEADRDQQGPKWLVQQLTLVSRSRAEPGEQFWVRSLWYFYDAGLVDRSVAPARTRPHHWEPAGR